MNDSSHLASQKPSPRFKSYREAQEEFRILVDAYRELCTALLEQSNATPATKARILSLRAVLEGRSDGS